jgi:tRNA threonylcarbamoyladenosine biosynthesis protein TsaE
VTDAELCIDLPTRRSTVLLARRLAPLLAPGDLVILSGELGAGKTFLVRAMTRALGLSERVRVTSPTFSLVHEHDTKPPIAHADLYRLNEAREVRDLGLVHQRDDGRLLLVEWGEPWNDLLGGDALVVALSVGPRRAQIRATGRRSGQILAALSGSG